MQKARNPKLEIRNKSKTPIAETLCTFWTGIWLRLKRDYSDPPRSFSQVDADRGPEVRGGKKGPSAGERGRRFQVSGVRCRERGVEVAGAVGHRVLGTGYFVLDTESQACCAHGSLTRHLTPLFCVPRIPYPASRTPHKKHQRAAPDTSEHRPWRVPWRRSDAKRRSDAQYKLHREAPVEAVDPETATNKRDASTQEGGLCRVPACTTQTVKLPIGPLFCFDVDEIARVPPQCRPLICP